MRVWRIVGECKPVFVDVERRTFSVNLLREKLELTGTHIGCDPSQWRARRAVRLERCWAEYCSRVARRMFFTIRSDVVSAGTDICLISTP
jgi:hypothetical protein